MLGTYEWELSNSWECYSDDFIFINCRECAEEFAEQYSVELNTGKHNYGEGPNGVGASECWACGHEFDYPPSCDGCSKYLRGNLTDEGRAYMLERLEEWPEWLVEYHLGEEAVNKQTRLKNALGAEDQVKNAEGVLVGYRTRLGGTYVCIECGHLCECNQEEE